MTTFDSLTTAHQSTQSIYIYVVLERMIVFFPVFAENVKAGTALLMTLKTATQDCTRN